MGILQVLGNDTDKMLGDFLRDNKVITQDIYSDSASLAGQQGKGLVSTLIERGHVNEDAIAASFASIFGFERVKLSPDMVASRPLQDKIQVAFIQKKRVLPVKLDGNTLTVAIADPSGLRHVSELKMMTGKAINTVVTELSTFDMVSEAAKPAVAAPAAIKPMPKPVIAKTKNEVEKVKMEAAGSEVIDFVNNVFIEAISNGISDIHIEAFRDTARIRFRKDGVLQDREDFAEFLNFNYSAITTRIKILASLDISERRLPQDGAISTEVTDTVVDIRVSILPTAHGERVVMRILDQSNANIKLDSLGIDPDVLVKLKKAINSPQGMVLVTGPTGSGKSTTLYAILKELNEPGVNILTAEDPVEYDLTGIGQVQVRDDIGLTFAAALRSFLRQDPEVIMVGEIRDKETSDIAIKASLTGHMVLSTLHTNDAPSTITRLINMGVPSYLITSAVSLIMAQRLARTLCQHCKEEHAVPEEEWLAIGFVQSELPGLKSYVAKGCETCSDSGIKGRRAIHEVLPITPPIREAVLKGASDADILEIARTQGFRTMQEWGRQLITNGTISIAEYKRILVLE